MLDARFTFTMAFQGFNVKTRSDALRRRSMVQCWSGPHVPTAVIWKFLRLLQLRVFSNNPARNSTKKNGLHVSSRSCVVGPSRHPFSSRVSTFLGWLNYPWPRCWMRASPLASWETKVLACARWPRSPPARCGTQRYGARPSPRAAGRAAQVDAIMGSLELAVAGVGGFCAGRHLTAAVVLQPFKLRGPWSLVTGGHW